MTLLLIGFMITGCILAVYIYVTEILNVDDGWED